ncbi:hypothetical protein DFH08DRAFT_838807 [Mycena albidolilacea]|uniref:Uncharacterized protein n=1 Tax=Mycena albidolilacea TaxID=1033008 RepID=A0AAD7AP98_9AGAR|nr:hypothetical protein DFH08DRAFT_838807 [Mycena albidolilacea]
MSSARNRPARPALKFPDELLATVLPDVCAQRRRDAFAEVVNTEGSFEAAIAFIKRIHEAVASGVVMGAPSPPAHRHAEVKSTDVGQFRIFYHATFPSHLQDSNAFMWNFYIGQRGQGLPSIMPDWARQGIVVKIPGLTGKWGECQALTVLPSTRVRISYHDSNRTQVTHEVVFPPDPRESSITVHYL